MSSINLPLILNFIFFRFFFLGTLFFFYTVCVSKNQCDCKFLSPRLFSTVCYYVFLPCSLLRALIPLVMCVNSPFEELVLKSNFFLELFIIKIKKQGNDMDVFSKMYVSV